MESKSIQKESLIMMLMSGGILLLNLMGFFTGFIVGIVACYFILKEYEKESDYIRVNGKELLNFHISFTIYTFIAALSLIIMIGVVLVPIVVIVYIVLSIIGMIKYGKKEYYEYPFTIQFIS